jgi:iron complex outermembrane recepter protein
MKILPRPLKFFIFLGFNLVLTVITLAQSTALRGKVTDKASGEALIGVNVSVRDRLLGTITDAQGAFELSLRLNPPFVIVFSSVGYNSREVQVTRNNTELSVELEETTLFGEEIVVSASRVEENILASPVSIEKISIMEIQQMPAANFFDGLYNLKGVDMNVSSLTFRFPNTRGFTGESNYRMNQLVDGVDNISPGLTFAAGNIFGLSQLDLESVELLVGASSALYGPGGMNGTLLMTSKSPFDYQGLSAVVQTGLMHVNAGYRDTPALMHDWSLRYARAFNDRLAFKVTANYLTALDWHASDFRDRNRLDDPFSTRETNEGYDGVNVYGDDIIVPVNLQDVAPSVAEAVAENQGLVPGTPEYEALVNRVISLFPDQIVSRTGWKEVDLAPYNTNNLRLSGAVHYRFRENFEMNLTGNYSQGTSVYTTTNRFSVRDFNITNVKLEIRSPEFFLRTWGVAENTGRSFDLGGAALRLSEAWKPSETWYQDYIGAFAQSRLLGSSLDDAYRFSRMVADNRDRFGNIFNPAKPAIPIPGTDEFYELWNPIAGTSVTEGGAKVIDQSKMWHIEGMYNLSRKIKVFELLVGVSHRIFIIDSQGTIFADEPGEPILVNQFGAYTQMSKGIWADRLKLTLSARYDKNEYFKGQFTPRFSSVYALNSKKENFLRASYQTAYRFPSISDQWVDFDIGFYQAVGGLPAVWGKYGFDTNPVYPLEGDNPITDKPVTDQGPFTIPPFGPEHVTALELGYKGLHFHKMLLVDAYVYRNTYNGFLSQQLLAQNPNTPDERRYQIVVSTDDPVSSFGWAFGSDLRLMKGFLLGGNVAYNVLQETFSQPGRQTRYNTPDYRFNLYVGNRELLKNLGFNINYRWQNQFLWQSNFGEATLPAFATLDAQVSYKIHRLKSIVRIGGSNILNQYYTTSYGSAQIGGLYYLSWHFDEFLN